MNLIILKIGLWIGIFDLIFCHTIPGGKSIGNDSIQEICNTFECLQAASQIKESMDETVSPCDNFYEFSCGNFLKQKVVPEDQLTINPFAILNEKVQEQFKSLIIEKPKTNLTFLLKPNLFYESCMNTASIEKFGSKPIRDIMNLLDGWPVILGKNWNSNGTWKWEKMMRILFQIGLPINFILNFMITPINDEEKWFFSIDAPRFILEKEFLIHGLNDPRVQVYYQYMIDVAIELGADRRIAQKELEASLNFEIDLANIAYLPPDRIRDFRASSRKMTIDELQKQSTVIDWLKYFNSLLPNGVQINKNTSLTLINLKFFYYLEYLLETRPKRDIANYLIWRVIDYSLPYLSENFENKKLEFSKALFGLEKLPPRWQKCVYETTENFPIQLNSLYIQKYFTSTKKQIVVEMIQNIRNEFFDILSENDWMDNRTLNNAKIKLNKMTYLLGSLDELNNDNGLEEYWKNLNLRSDKYFDSQLKIVTFNRKYKFQKLPSLINVKYWNNLDGLLRVNAYNDFNLNFIVIPAPILQDKFFDANRPKYMNFGAIGAIIGHEIIHGYDDEGKQFDSDGFLFNWWEKETDRIYRLKADCIVNQYGNYTDTQTGLKLNGFISQGENIADNGGLKISYLAYKKWVEKNGSEQKLPGFRYKPEQLFWISHAQIWCSKYKKELLEHSIALEGHLPHEFRVVGSIQNRKEFSKDFQCPLGSPMNPKEKCNVW